MGNITIRLSCGDQPRPRPTQEEVPEDLVAATVEAAVQIGLRDASPASVLSAQGAWLVCEAFDILN